jgi:hypothetical protein
MHINASRHRFDCTMATTPPEIENTPVPVLVTACGAFHCALRLKPVLRGLTQMG